VQLDYILQICIQYQKQNRNSKILMHIKVIQFKSLDRYSSDSPDDDLGKFETCSTTSVHNKQMLIRSYLLMSSFYLYHCCVDGPIYAIIHTPEFIPQRLIKVYVPTRSYFVACLPTLFSI
jgi:hypothetical protein